MKCPECHTENLDTRKFCRDCGAKLSETCSQCGTHNLPKDKYCGECGQRLVAKEEFAALEAKVDSGRKHVTVLFTDMVGYTSMSERLDPEEVKEITSRVFGEIAQVVSKYDGFIEKFVGDAVVAFLGVPMAHEDDPVRAIKAAREIHDLVEAMSTELEARIGQPLSMRTGINTGLVVTGEVNLEMGTHGVAGDTINLASRLSNFAKPGEILVAHNSYLQAEGYFAFGALDFVKVEGKSEPVQVYKVESPKELPRKTRRLSGLRADLIGREAEMAQLSEAVEKLGGGKRTVFSISGDVGSGKSRLVEEFKATIDHEAIQWREGHAYTYSQNIPYFPLIDLINRALQIEEDDPPTKVKEKIESGVENLIGKREDVVPYVGGLYSLNYPELEEVSPEVWKSRLHKAIRTVFSALTQRAPTVICLEDLQWADPSSLELLRFILSESRYPVLFLCVYRPVLSLFGSHQRRAMGKTYQEIRLQELSPSEALKMMKSLLKAETIPFELERLIRDKVEGNPFYLEEVINSMIEAETLVRDTAGWILTTSISEVDIPSTIHGAISARLDRLEKVTKRILQEASVIGRAFLYDILKQTSELKNHIDRGLSALERLDMIRTRSLHPDLEYIFKHALTQEVVYNGLLKKERRNIHDRIAQVMERLFHDRLPEFYETLAFHYKHGQITHKAVDYLIKSGEKSLGRYALEESHQYFSQAFDLLVNKSDRTKEEEELLVDLLNKWAFIFHWRGAYSRLFALLKDYEVLAETLDDKEKLGMFYFWLGLALESREKMKDAYHYLWKALEIGEEIESNKVIGFACAWLTRTCAELGLLDDAITFGKRAQELSRLIKSEQELFVTTLVGMGLAYYYRGESKETDETGKIMLDYGMRQSHIRSTSIGHLFVGVGHAISGDFTLATQSLQDALHASADPATTYWARLWLVIPCIYKGQFQEAERALREIISFSENFGTEVIGTTAKGLLSVVLLAGGNLEEGETLWEAAIGALLQSECRSRAALLYNLMANGYLLGAQKTGFQKAEDHFNKAIEVAKEIGAKVILGEAYLGLGLLEQRKGRIDQARKWISEGVLLFEEAGAETYLKRAKNALESLG